VDRPSLADLHAAARTLGVDVAAAQAVATLHRAGCANIVLKGATFGRELHAAGSLRRYVDVDLLVSPRDVDAAGAALASIGFKLMMDHRDHATIADPHAQEWQRPPADKVDLHWTVPGVGIAAADAWAVLETRTVPFSIGNETARGLDRAGIALLVALHVAHHGRALEKPLDDLARALDQFDVEVWREAALLAHRLEATEAFVAGLRLSAAGVALEHDLQLRVTFSPQRTLMMSSPPVGSVGLHRVLDARRGRARMVRHTLFPAPAFMRAEHSLARRGRGGLVLAYCFRLLARARAFPAALRAVRASRDDR
jgi:hypothetical protein